MLLQTGNGWKQKILMMSETILQIKFPCMKRFICTLLSLLPLTISAQAMADTTTFRDPANYSTAVEYYLKKIETGDAGPDNFYQAACYFSLLNNYDKAFNCLKEAVKRGAKGEDVITDTDFDILKQDWNRWNEVDALLKAQYFERNPGISKVDLGYELWLMWIEDQRYRTLKKNYKLEGRPITDIEKHNKHLSRLKEIVENTGWPKYSEVGIEAGDAVFFIFQHDDAKNMKSVLPEFIAVAKAGEADIKKAAMMIDRYLAYTEHLQIYGTQAFRKMEPGQNRNDIPLALYPIADEENLIKRREAIGMVDFLENCERLGVEYIPVQKRSDYKAIAIKKKWIKAGFIF